MRKYKNIGFTLIEILIAMIIVGLLGTMAISQFQAMSIKTRISEIFPVFNAIAKAEELYYLEYGNYAAYDDGIPGGDLPYSDSQANADNFENILGIKIPWPNPNFYYGVYYRFVYSGQYTAIYAQNAGWLCRYYLEGPNKGKWGVNTYDPPGVGHPWAKYCNPPGPRSTE